MARVVIIGNQGLSMLNFRGPLIEELHARGHQVVAFAPEMSAEIAAQIQKRGALPIEFKLARTGLNVFADMASLLELRALLVDQEADVVLSYMAKPAIYGTIAAWLAGVPSRFAMIEGLGYVFVPRQNESPSKRALRGGVQSLYRAALSKAKRVIFLNQDDIDDFVAMRLIDKGKTIKLGGIGVDLDKWSPRAMEPGPTTFTLVARLLKDKGVAEFAEAARIVRKTHPEARFLLVGGTDHNPQSISHHQVSAWRDEGILEWTGHTAVQPQLRRTSVFVLPSYYREGVPLSTQEAMAMGLPIITTNVPGCRDTVVDGVNGLLVPPRDSEALARAMQYLIQHPHLLATMGQESRRMAEERFDVRKVNARLIDILGL